MKQRSVNGANNNIQKKTNKKHDPRFPLPSNLPMRKSTNESEEIEIARKNCASKKASLFLRK